MIDVKRFRFVLVVLAALTCCGPTQKPVKLGDTAMPPYNRDEWGRWIDADKDCQDTRQEVLIAESTEPVSFEDDRHCRVKSGKWIDPYTGQTFTDPHDLEIDHAVPLAEAHRSGGWKWDVAKKSAYYNNLTDPEALVAVSVFANRSKGDRSPSAWLPPNESDRCKYLLAWARVKTVWSLDVTPEESLALVHLIGTYCVAVPRSLPAL